ncbi:MAG: zf-HC2 domain-containing protein [Armatimonadota bacterium]
MTCKLCRERLSDFIEGDLPPEVEDRIRAHLAECEECAREFAQIRAVVAAVHALPEVAPPRELRERLRRIPTMAAEGLEGGHAWRRLRYVVATVAAAAAALLLIWTGTTVFEGDATIGEFGPRGTETMAEAPSPAPGEATAESDLLQTAPGGDEGEVPLEEAAREEAPPVEMRGSAPQPREMAEEASLPEAEEEREPAPPPPVRPRRESPGAAVAEGGGHAPGEAAGTSRPARTPQEVAPPSEAEAQEAMDTEAASDAVVPRPGAAEMAAGAAVEGAAGGGMAGSRGPAEPGDTASRLEMARPGGTLAVPQPRYLEAGADGVAVAEPEEGSPFTVSITPPRDKTTGRIVPATITVETEKDVARAQITVSGSDELDLVGVRGDGVLFDDALTAGQETVLSVRMLAREAGRQVLHMRLRSTDPVVDTELAVSMGQFTEPVPPRERMVSFAFEGTPLREAVAELVRQSGVRVHVDNAVGGDSVTIATEDEIPAEAALRSIAEAAGLEVRVTEDALFIEPAEP